MVSWRNSRKSVGTALAVAGLVATALFTGAGTGSAAPVAPAVAVSYDLAGKSNLNGMLRGPVALAGHFTAQADLDAGTYTGDLVLNPTTGTFHIMEMLEASADIAFEPAGRASGTFTAGAATFTVPLTVKLTKVVLFGLPISEGDTCQTSAPAEISLSAKSGFDVLKGGKLFGFYGLAGVKDCGFMNDLINYVIRSNNNTVDMTLTARP